MIMIDASVPMEDVVKEVSPNTIWWLLILLGVNILLMVLKFILDVFRDKRETHSYKIKRISESVIKVEGEIYKKLQELATFQKDDCHKMLDKIIELDNYMEANSLYISKKYRDEAVKTLDYFKRVVTDFGEKDNKKEGRYFHGLSNIFYGE